jgi:hypothetical protein
MNWAIMDVPLPKVPASATRKRFGAAAGVEDEVDVRLISEMSV